MGKWMYKGILSVEVHADRELTDKEVEDITWRVANNSDRPLYIEVIDDMTVDVEFLGEKMTDADAIPFDEREQK